MIILPPKRFESLEDPRFDSIRHKSWYGKMAKRKWQLPALKQAHAELVAYSDKTRKEVAESFGIDERELRDYIKFVTGVPGNGQKPGFLCVLDDSYLKYCQDLGKHHILAYIAKECPFWGLKARHVQEAWDCDPTFYPTGYKK